VKGLYVHIPFCESICHYCDFVKRVPKDQEMIDRYLVSLREEIKSYQHHFKTIETIYIGGGNTFKLLKELKESGFDKELLKFIKEGKPVYGGSAGALILGKNILTKMKKMGFLKNE